MAAAGRAASALIYVNTGRYPKTFKPLTAGSPRYLVATDGVSVTADSMQGGGWALWLVGGGSHPPTFMCTDRHP